MDGIEEADVGGQFGSHCLELVLAFNSWAAFGGPDSCTDVNRAPGGSWPEEGQPPPQPQTAGQSAPRSAEEAAAASFSVCCDQVGSVGWSRQYETPAQLPLRCLPCHDCTERRRGESALLWEPAVPGRHAWCRSEPRELREEGAVLQAQRLLLFSGSAEEIFCLHPCSLRARAMARDKQPSHDCITQRRKEPPQLILFCVKGK